MDEHVGTKPMAIGEIGSLARLEIQTELTLFVFCVLQKFIDRHVECCIGGIGPCDALKPKRRRSRLRVLQCRLDVYMSQNAVRNCRTDFEGIEDLFKR